MSLRRSDWAALVAILGVALSVRLIKLDAGLWYDEIVTLVDFVRLPTWELVDTFTTFNNHILYSLLAQLSVAVFGESAWALRLPAVAFGVASVGALWWLTLRIATPYEAHFTALLLAVSYHHVWFSQNARGYTAMMFWALVGTVLFVRGIEQPSRRVWVAYALVAAAAGYTHLSIGFFFASHGLVYLGYLAVVAHRRRTAGGGRGRARLIQSAELQPLLGFALAGILVAVLYAPVVPDLLRTIEVDSTLEVVASGEGDPARNPVWAVFEILRNLQGLGFVAGLGLPIVLGFSILGGWDLLRKRPLVAWAFLANIPFTLAGLLIISLRIRPRFFFIDQGFVFLCMVHGLFVFSAYLARARTFERLKLSGVRLGTLASAAAVAGSLFLLPQNFRYPKQDFLGAQELVESIRGADDAVVSVGLASVAYSRYYAPEWRVARTWDEVDRIRSGSERTWVVHGFPNDTALKYPKVVERLASEFDLVERFPGTLGDGSVLVYRSRVAEPAEKVPHGEEDSSGAPRQPSVVVEAEAGSGRNAASQ